MNKIVIEPVYCKGCGLCINVCPNGLIAIGDDINDKGYKFAVQTDASKCTACRLCAIMCPDSAITVFKGEKGGANA